MPNTAYILEDAGFTRQQVDALTVHWEGSVATKADIARLEGKIDSTAADLRGEIKEEISELRGELKADIAELRGELKADIAELRGELKADIAELRTELKYVKWIGAAILVGVFIPIVKDLLV